MTESEALKLPKPIPGSDFLTFPTDRRWDILGFVKSDEVEDIKCCEIGPDGLRYYLIHWKASWKPESALIYCEKLLQDYWLKNSIIHQENSLPKNTVDQVDSNNLNSDASFKNTSSSINEDNPVCIESSDAPRLAESISEDESSSSVNFVVTTKNVDERSGIHLSDNATNSITDEKIESVVPKSQEVNVIEKKAERVEKDGHVESIHDENGIQTGSDLSKKGAPKRKARPPRQSVHSVNDKVKNIKKRDKGRKAKCKKAKVPKISKTLSTVIDPSNREGITQNDETLDEEGQPNNLKCMVCDKHLASEQSLMKHLLTHNNNHTCTICMKTFKSTHFLKHHMDKHNLSYQYSCPICDKKFKFKNNMRGHLRKHNMEKKFQCEICQKKFIGRYNLKEHMKAHSDSRPFECDFCKKSYKDRGALNKHLLTHQEKKVQCEICKRPFTNAAQVKRHMQFHYSWPGDSYKRKTNIGPDGEKVKYNCPHCEKTFNHYSNMNAHIHKKHIEKKITCPECPKTFAYQYELREHMFIHVGGENSKFKCQFCDKTFQRSTTLKNHERTTHLGIKRFKCETCGKMFGTKFNMKVHVEKLHNSNSEGQTKVRRTRATNPEPDVTSIVSQTNPNMMPPLPALPPVATAGLSAHPMLRSITTSDIIRNAMSHIPELGYFPGLPPNPARAYQFYGMPPTDFGVS